MQRAAGNTAVMTISVNTCRTQAGLALCSVGPQCPNSDFQHRCPGREQGGGWWWDETLSGNGNPPSTACVSTDNGKSGVLLAGTCLGDVYETPTQQGVTGLDGRFQYGPGETVRFKIGDTLLGAVTGRAR